MESMSLNPLAAAQKELEWHRRAYSTEVRLDLACLERAPQPLREDFWRALARIVTVQHLAIAGDPGEPGWQAIGKLLNLGYLTLTRITELPAAGWSALAGLKALVDLRIEDSSLSFQPEDWDNLGRLTRLQSLTFDHTGLSFGRGALSSIGRLRWLRCLFIMGDGVEPGAPWDALTGLELLRQVNVRHVPAPAATFPEPL
jgi:hypothetical protein